MIPRLALALLAAPCSLAAQADWAQLSPTQLPPALSDHVLMADVRGALLFGGDNPTTGLSSDTWRFDGTNWTQLQPINKPSARMRHAGTYDRARNRFVVFGGSTSLAGGLMNDTWEFDGNDWKQITTTQAPSARNDHAMCYDTVGRRILLYGGRTATGDAQDTWSYDGTNWTQITTTASPPGRRDHGLAFDPFRGVALTYGGFYGSGLNVRQDTWEFDGTNWAQRMPTQVPGNRVGYGMVFDELRARTVMFSGYAAPSQPDETWEWDGNNWTLQSVLSKPTGRSGHAMTYDFVRGRSLLYGGWDTGHNAETWVYGTATPARFTTYGTACSGSGGTPVLALVPGKLPWIGDTHEVTIGPIVANAPVLMFLGFSDTNWGAFTLPLPLTTLGATGCSLLASPDLAGVAITTGTAATWSLPIPSTATLVGTKYYLQALVVDAAANTFGAAFSDGGSSEIGRR
ncbi:MAG: hypothetical protein KDC95_17720 [Planctomycetes bacterium]|nr:hypothetical protein [Planctomycetota bacterium]